MCYTCAVEFVSSPPAGRVFDPDTDAPPKCPLCRASITEVSPHSTHTPTYTSSSSSFSSSYKSPRTNFEFLAALMFSLSSLEVLRLSSLGGSSFVAATSWTLLARAQPSDDSQGSAEVSGEVSGEGSGNSGGGEGSSNAEAEVV